MNESLSFDMNIQLSSRNLPQCSLYGDTFYMERVLMYCHGLTEHTVILEAYLGILGVFDQSGV